MRMHAKGGDTLFRNSVSRSDAIFSITVSATSPFSACRVYPKSIQYFERVYPAYLAAGSRRRRLGGDGASLQIGYFLDFVFFSSFFLYSAFESFLFSILINNLLLIAHFFMKKNPLVSRRGIHLDAFDIAKADRHFIYCVLQKRRTTMARV